MPKNPDFDYDPKKSHPPTAEDLQFFVGLTPEDGLNDLAAHYHQRTLIAYHRWARIMLSLLINKVQYSLHRRDSACSLTIIGLLYCIPTVSEKRQEQALGSRPAIVCYPLPCWVRNQFLSMRTQCSSTLSWLHA